MAVARPTARFHHGQPLLVVVFLILVPPLLLHGSSPPELSCSWRDREIRIDGDDEDWRDLTRPVAGQKFAMGLLNDAEALYLCLVTKDRATSAQITRQGLILWFSRPDDRKHGFGVQFPFDGAGPMPGRPAGREALGIFGPGRKDVRRVPMEEAGGIVACVGVHGDLVVYEARLPIKAGGGEYAVAAEPGGNVRLELMTPEWRGPLPRARSPIGFGVAGGPGPGGMVGYPLVDAAMLRPLDVAATLRLASR
jgi:hypothetical protein